MENLQIFSNMGNLQLLNDMCTFNGENHVVMYVVYSSLNKINMKIKVITVINCIK